MLGLERREWKHARKTRWHFFRELIVAAFLVVLVAGVWVFLPPGGERFDELGVLDPIESPEYFDPMDTTSGTQVIHGTVEARIILAVEKEKHLLTVYDGIRPLKSYRIAVGRNAGDKQRAGDLRTPEGTFPVRRIHDAQHWVHDFGDGKGAVAGAYGPLFIRLDTSPWKGIGIHGTHDPASLGTNATEGCIRMQNDELLELAAMIGNGTTVIIR